MNKFKTLFICAGMLLTFKSYSQNIPLGTLPMIYNGGFAGEATGGRFNMGASVYKSIYRTPPPNWPTTARILNDDVYRSYFFSYDQFIKKLSTGVGITVIDNASLYKDHPTLQAQRGTFVVASISPKLSFNGKYTLAPFINFVYSDSRYTYSDSRYIYSNSNSDSLVRAVLQPQIKQTISARYGFLFNSSKFYFGLSFNFMNTNTHTYTNDLFVYPLHSDDIKAKGQVYPKNENPYRNSNHGVSWLFQIGRTFQKLPESKFSFTTQLALQYIKYYHYDSFYGYVSSYNERRVDVNLFFRYDKFIASINNNGLGIGYQNYNLKILLSQNRVFFDKQEKETTISVRYLLRDTK